MTSSGLHAIALGSGRTLRLDTFPGVMAIVNVTPDSFSDGGRFPTPAAAADEALRFADLGAAMVDVGGESTRPKGKTYGEGAGDVPLADELARVVPVIASIRARRPELPVSVDTRRTEIARAALDAGADVVNVVTGLDVPPDLLEFVVSRGAAIVLNHCRGTPQTTFEVSRFTDVVSDVASDLAAARLHALAAGIRPDRIFLDPGLGFGKTWEHNFALLGALDEIVPSGAALVVGASRKAFLSSLPGQDGPTRPASDRLPESLGAVAHAARAAASRPVLVRVHDVGETLRFLSVLRRSAPR